MHLTSDCLLNNSSALTAEHESFQILQLNRDSLFFSGSAIISASTMLTKREPDGVTELSNDRNNNKTIKYLIDEIINRYWQVFYVL